MSVFYRGESLFFSCSYCEDIGSCNFEYKVIYRKLEILIDIYIRLTWKSAGMPEMILDGLAYVKALKINFLEKTRENCIFFIQTSQFLGPVLLHI